MTPDIISETARAILDDTRRMIEENLRDPDLAARSEDFKAGYARGFYEAVAGFVSERLKRGTRT